MSRVSPIVRLSLSELQSAGLSAFFNLCVCCVSSLRVAHSEAPIRHIVFVMDFIEKCPHATCDGLANEAHI